MTKFRDKLAALMLMSALAVCPVLANAVSMEQMFNSMGNSTPAGAYHGQTQNVYTGGSMSMRLPQKNYQFMSFAPPSFSAGCGGIDIFGGSFSFINSQQLINVLQNIGSAALSQAFFMAIDAMSPMVGVNLKQLMDKLQKATNQSINSCQTGKELAGLMMDGTSEKWKKWSEDRATEWFGSTNSYNDMGQSQNETPKDQVKVAEGAINSIQDKKAMGGNLVWNALAQMNTDPANPLVSEFEARLIMSLVGTIIVTHDPTSNQVVKIGAESPLVQAQTLENIIGIADGVTTTLAGFDIYQCVDGTTNGAPTATKSGAPDPGRNHSPHAYQCVSMTPVPVESASGGGGAYKSMFSMVDERMKSISNAIKDNNPISAADIKFINTVNIPVYKMLSVSVALRNSGLGDVLIQENAKVVAAEYAAAYISNLLDILSHAISKLSSQPGYDKAAEEKKITEATTELRKLLYQQLQKAYASQHEKNNLANKIMAMEKLLLSSIPTTLSGTMSMRKMGY